MYGLGETWEAGVPRSSSCMEKAADPSYYSGHYCEKDNLRIPISVEYKYRQCYNPYALPQLLRIYAVQDAPEVSMQHLRLDNFSLLLVINGSTDFFINSRAICMSLSIIKTTCGCVDMYQGFPPRGSLSVTVLLPSFIRMVSTPWVCDQLAMDLPHSF